jgi:hypothetical protein
MKKIFLLFLVISNIVLGFSAPNKIYWCTYALGNIYVADLNGSNQTLLVSGNGVSGEVEAMRVDFYGGKIYWASNQDGLIRRCDLDGTHIDTIITETPGGEVLSGLTLDLNEKKIYYISDRDIKRADLDGKNIEMLFTPAFDPYGLDIDTQTKKIYWTYADGDVYRADQDGSNSELLIDGNDFAFSVTVDSKKEKLYVSYLWSGIIVKADLTGANQEDFLTGLGAPAGVSLDNTSGKIYWGEYTGNKISRCNFDTTDKEDVITGISDVLIVAFPSVANVPTGNEDGSVIFGIDNFIHPEMDFLKFKRIQIIEDVDKGILYLDKNLNDTVDNLEDLAATDTVSKADLDAGKLKFISIEDESGSPYTSYTYKWYDGTSYSDSTYIMYIFITEIDDPSVISYLESTDLYFRGGSQTGVKLTSAITIFDKDDTHLDSTQVQISNNYASAEDSIYYTGTVEVMSEWNKTTGILTLKGSFTKSDYETILSSVYYINHADTATENKRTISFSVYARGNSSNTISRDIMVGSKYEQTITFGILPEKVYQDPDFDIAAQSSMNLPVSFVSSNLTVAEVTGNTISIIGAGTSIITAVQLGNDTIMPADSVKQILTINKAPQTITFNALSEVTEGSAPFDLAAFSSSELTITYESSLLSVVTINGNTVTIVGPGTTTITAQQEGNENFEAAPDVTRDLIVNTATGTNDQLSIQIDVFPNPAVDVVNISSYSGEKIGKVTFYSMAGSIVLSGNVDKSTGSFDVSSLSNGIYTVLISTQTGVAKVKLLINK